VNIFLIPYTGFRHLSMALFVGAATTLAWWGVLTWIVFLGPLLHGWLYWPQWLEGLVFLSTVSGAAGAASVLGEGNLRRRAVKWRIVTTATSFAVTFALTAGAFLATRSLVTYLSTIQYAHLAEDPSVVTLRFTLTTWATAGAASGLGPWIVRKFQRVTMRAFNVGGDAVRPRASAWSDRFLSLFLHTGAGTAGALAGAIVWHVLGLYAFLQGDLYLAAALGATVWGFVHGLLAWPIPDDLYAGWIRVLSPEDYGLRIPIDREDGLATERFVGHFPRGLDLHREAEHGVAELHASFVVDEAHNYRVRGLTILPTTVSRLMEQVRLDYDPRRPAPLEADLKMGDRIRMGEGANSSEVEFLLLPKEER
jgi:hypothetical protein